MECKRAENLIDAQLDGELDAIHSAELDIHLHDCPACQSLMNRRRALQKALQANLPYFPAPQDLRRSLKRTGPAKRPLAPFKFAIAAAFFLAVGGLTVFYLDRSTAPTTQAQFTQLADAIESSHMRSLQPDHLLDVVSTDKHTVKPWFAGKLPFTPPVRDFAADGFPLIGGRLDVINHQPVAALIYHRNKHILNLFTWPSTTPESPTQLTTPRGFHVLYWSDGTNAYWLISDIEPAELVTFADLLRSPPAFSSSQPVSSPK